MTLDRAELIVVCNAPGQYVLQGRLGAAALGLGAFQLHGRGKVGNQANRAWGNFLGSDVPGFSARAMISTQRGKEHMSHNILIAPTMVSLRQASQRMQVKMSRVLKVLVRAADAPEGA